MNSLSQFPGTTVHVEVAPDGKVKATVYWDGTSKTDPIFWGSDEMFSLTPDERTALVAMAPIFSNCARKACPAMPTQSTIRAKPRPSLLGRIAARFARKTA